MTQSDALRLVLPNGEFAESEPAIDVNAMHELSFVRNRWFSGLSSLVQTALMGSAGGFLFTQISSTPRLMVQMTIVSILLSLGGALIALMTVRDFFGYVRITPALVAGRTGFTSFHLAWSEVGRWRVNELAKTPELSSVELWSATESEHVMIPGGMLSKLDLQKIRRLCNAHASGKNATG